MCDNRFKSCYSENNRHFERVCRFLQRWSTNVFLAIAKRSENKNETMLHILICKRRRRRRWQRPPFTQWRAPPHRSSIGKNAARVRARARARERLAQANERERMSRANVRAVVVVVAAAAAAHHRQARSRARSLAAALQIACRKLERARVAAVAAAALHAEDGDRRIESLDGKRGGRGNGDDDDDDEKKRDDDAAFSRSLQRPRRSGASFFLS